MWNVNISTSDASKPRRFVLIETLWNVNEEWRKRLEAGEVSINRNIVECKWKMLKEIKEVVGVLIETLWNVNLFVRHIAQFFSCCINRNIVECKFVHWAVKPPELRRINRNIVECK